MGVSRRLPILIPSTQSGWALLRFQDKLAATVLLKTKRLISARSIGKRNILGFAPPGWGSSVTVPTSISPNPSADNASTATPFLSKPAARPTGLGNDEPKRLSSPKGARLN